MFSIDGTVWNVPCQIEREAQMQASEISGMLLDRTYFNDVLGTYMSYTVSIAVPFDRLSLYRAIYDKLTNPLEAHIFVLPFDDATITLTGRVERVSDSWVRMPGDQNYWRNITFTVTAIHPSRYYSLREAVSRGRPIVPAIDGGRAAVLDSLSVTKNGLYAPDSGVDGFDRVVVAVGDGAGDDPADNLIERWDFKRSLTGLIRGLTPTVNNVTRDDSGLIFTGGNVRVEGLTALFPQITVEIDVARMNCAAGRNNRFMIARSNNCGLVYRDSGVWAFYDGSAWTDSGETDPAFFDGATARICIDRDRRWHIYRSGALWWEPDAAPTPDRLWIGSTDQSMADAVITGMRVY